MTLATLVFTLGDMLWSILLSLLTGAFFGIWIAREARVYFNGPTIGEALNRRGVGGCIICDECGAETPRAGSLERVIRDPRNDGWTFGHRDLCPECSMPQDAETHSEN